MPKGELLLDAISRMPIELAKSVLKMAKRVEPPLKKLRMKKIRGAVRYRLRYLRGSNWPY